MYTHKSTFPARKPNALFQLLLNLCSARDVRIGDMDANGESDDKQWVEGLAGIVCGSYCCIFELM